MRRKGKEIILEILKALNEEEELPRGAILTKTKLNHATGVKFLNFLQELGLIEHHLDFRYKKKSFKYARMREKMENGEPVNKLLTLHKYSITPHGKEYLQFLLEAG